MKILHVLDVLTLGGGQGLALRVLDGLVRRGEENALCVLLTEARTHTVWAPAVEPWYLEFHGDYRRPLAWQRCVAQLADRIRAYQPDVVLSLNWLADVTAARACRITRVPHVAYLVDRRDWLTSQSWRPFLRRWITRSAFRRANTDFMAVSESVADFVATHLPQDRARIEVVRNSIDVRDFAPIAEQRRQPQTREIVTVGMLSQLKEEKGHGVFLDAIQELVKRGITLRGMIGGEGRLRDYVASRVARPELRGCVSLVGLVNDTREFYRECDIFAVPSIHSEGLPTTILEAMACGCALVATDVGGAREVIDSEINGLIVPPLDALAFADALETLIRGDERRRRMRVQASEKALREFDVEPMLDRVLYVLNGALSDSARPTTLIEEPVE